MATTDNKAIGPRFFMEQDRLRGGPARELCAPDYVIYLAGNPPMDYEGHQQFGRAFYGGFPDLYHAIDDVIVEGDKVVVRFTLRGTHTGDFMGIPPTGKPVTVGAIAIMRVVEGQVAEIRGEFDQLGMLRQLGVVD